MFRSAFVNLYTRDIESSVSFYQDLLGFVETYRTPREGVPEHVEMTLDGFALGLGSVDAAQRILGVAAQPGSPAMVVAVWCDDVDESFDALTATGVAVVRAPTSRAARTAAPCCATPTATSSRSGPSAARTGASPSDSGRAALR